MKTTYSILYSPINTLTQERLNLGMLMMDEAGKIFFRYSQEKLSAAKKLFNEDGYKLLYAYMTAINRKLNGGSEIIDGRLEITEGYLDYLADYANNLLRFTKSHQIDVELTNSTFDKLYEKYIFKERQEPVKQEVVSSIQKIKTKFIPRVKDRVDTDATLDADEFDFIMFNLKIDMIGKNDRPVLNQFVDFELSQQYIQKRITDYISIIKPFELKENQPGKFFIVGNEPSKKADPKRHLIWKHLMDSPLITKDILEVVPPKEMDKIEDYLIQHDVRPFFERL